MKQEIIAASEAVDAARKHLSEVTNKYKNLCLQDYVNNTGLGIGAEIVCREETGVISSMAAHSENWIDLWWRKNKKDGTPSKAETRLYNSDMQHVKVKKISKKIE